MCIKILWQAGIHFLLTTRIDEKDEFEFRLLEYAHATMPILGICGLQVVNVYPGGNLVPDTS
jgi:gamma-glutamyl-gamma-aminobutyrate hydrolase PuuD